ncbi:MAG: DUF445 domain-containing protein [Bacillaceae bacterium]
MKGKYRLANISLFIVLIGFLLTYPFSTSFWGGLLYSGFCAALIGGLADWFAVTALFRKPLGISNMNLGCKDPIIRTEIIPRNREKVMNTLRYMINEELLTKDMLKGKVQQIDIVKFVTDLYEKEENKANFMMGLSKIFEQMLDTLTEEEIATLCHTILKKEGDNIHLADFLYNFFMYLQKNKYDEQVLYFFLKIAKELIVTEEVRLILTELVENVRNNYSEGNKARKMATTLLFEQILKTSSDEIALEIQTYLSTVLTEMMANDMHPYQLIIKEKVDFFALQLKTNEYVREKIEQWKQKQLSSLALYDFFIKIATENLEKEKRDKYVQKIVHQIEQYVGRIEENEREREKMNGYIKDVIIQLIEKQHKKIDALIMSKLNSFTNEEFAALIEEKAGSDLQMIRMNGTFVGGLVGILFYLLTNWL